MVQFVLRLNFSDEKDNSRLSVSDREDFLDTHIEKKVEMPVIPRIGEEIELGSVFLVSHLLHNITTRTVEVECDVNLLDGVCAYVADNEGWNLDHMSFAGKDVFCREVKLLEERMKVSAENLRRTHTPS